MKLIRIIVSNYRCFGKEPTTIEINELTGFIGHNSSGKTALLSALIKLFGEKPSDRIIERSDFHIPASIEPDSVSMNELYIEVQFEFPELELDDDNISIPVFFKNMLVSETNGKPYLRIRLEANWERSSNPEGSIDSNVYYITSTTEEINPEDKHTIKRYDLDQIKVIYVPAIRKPDEQLKNVSGTIISRLLNGINWSEQTKIKIKTKAGETEKVFLEEKGVESLKKSLENQWNGYHKDFRYSNPKINFNSTDLETILKKVEVTFSPTETPREYRIEELGDGLRSLFYLSLVNTLLEIEEEILRSINDGEEQCAFTLLPPVLTIVAVEEPENHISPHLLGRVVEKLHNISTKQNSQTLLTSHTPSIVKRIQPTDIRYFRISKEHECTKVKSLMLPDQEKESEQFKFVKEAVLAYPDLYFAKLVVLGEGDSEEIIIKKMIELKAASVDSSEISIVPLGGRHVNHFWRLLNDLEIPFITLLDLDRERDGGGWGRIKYVIQQLIDINFDKNLLLKTSEGILIDNKFEKMHTWDVTETEIMSEWIEMLKDYDVYFSSPLDIDFAMLQSFKDIYISLLSSDEGPRISGHGKIQNLVINKDTKNELKTAYLARIDSDIRATLKQEGGHGTTYSENEKELMIWYSYFFLGRGKPTTHLSLFSNNDDLEFKSFPDCLKEFIDSVIKKMSDDVGDEEDEDKLD
ncbi:putative ATP-dependent endonuclease of OLD family [Desulfitispora alkaliphila]|uniref:ATP-dependent nuclease n=1 Tax=Desulfitispora alkaliphila TaxID=622674 RepID=UPI003D19C6FD